MQYKLATGHFPTTEQNLKALIAAPDGESGWRGPYLADNIKDVPKDPWGNYYQYQYPGTHNTNSYDCWSMGPDGQNGTADDIGNWSSQ
jgi:general secretion pathway protein G